MPLGDQEFKLTSQPVELPQKMLSEDQELRLKLLQNQHLEDQESMLNWLPLESPMMNISEDSELKQMSTEFWADIEISDFRIPHYLSQSFLNNFSPYNRKYDKVWSRVYFKQKDSIKLKKGCRHADFPSGPPP